MTAKHILSARVRPRRYAAALVAVFFWASPSAAITDADIVQLIAQGRVNQARAIMSQFDPSETDWLFFEGRVAKASGAYQSAIQAFREVLRRDPSYLNAKRELAHTLLLVSDYRGSTHHFRQLLRIDKDAIQRRGYIIFLDEINNRRPFSLSARFAVVASSNVNRGSSETVFHPGVPDIPSFNITSRAETGTGVELGLHGVHKWQSSNDLRWTFTWGISGRKFKSTEYDRATLSGRLEFGRLTADQVWAFGPFTRLTYRGDDSDNTAIGLGGNLTRRISSNYSLFLSGSVEHRDFSYLKMQDGPLYALQFGFDRVASHGTITLGARLRIAHPEQAHQRYAEHSVFLGRSRSWSGGLHAGAQVEVGQRAFDAEFPLAGVARQDDFVRLNLTVRHDALRVGAFAPTLTCTFGDTGSNVAFYEHSVNECTIGVTRRF
ncbi:hypothetical protein GCM10007385_39530 [Tateyamaria omphalii]|uniref:surface lipoprotein assembly modifier n=1 Tax=Tateyamaria omphalii TaxID=299262 RepID=UPI001678A4D4|nr:surface lipoprotein assembly modifier [Tateyamaria omphalii]GGX66386.1 hypothetical protein GCM10007385_39530 [Tateyamaria omphalii]